MTLREYIEDSIREIEDHYVNIALTNDYYVLVSEASMEELPTLINHESELVKDLVKAKLNGESILSCKYTHQVCWNLEFNMDQLKELNFYDGEAVILSRIANFNGWEDLKDKALECVYND